MKITTRGLPWQKIEPSWANNADKTNGETYGWNPFNVRGMGRFGGGWAFKLGIQVSESCRDWIISIGLGEIRIQFKKP
jgi:hypothetical protein